MYKRKQNYTTPLMLLSTPKKEKINGVIQKKYEVERLIFASFKSFGGTDITVNGVYSIEDTAEIETWYRDDIKSNCAIKTQSGNVYEIISEPENVEMRNQIMKFKVKRIKGGV